MKGFTVLDGADDLSESIVLTFWESKEDVDKFYQTDNGVLANLVEKLKPSFGELPERLNYQVSNLILIAKLIRKRNFVLIEHRTCHIDKAAK